MRGRIAAALHEYQERMLTDYQQVRATARLCAGCNRPAAACTSADRSNACWSYGRNRYTTALSTGKRAPRFEQLRQVPARAPEVQQGMTVETETRDTVTTAPAGTGEHAA